MTEFNREATEARVAEVMTKANLLAWLKTQDPETTYDYFNNRDCLLARYSKAMGITPQHSSVGSGYVRAGDGNELIDISREFTDLIYAGFGVQTYAEKIAYLESLPD